MTSSGWPATGGDGRERGRSGLGVGYWLQRASSLSFLVLDAAPEIGRSWASDTLELFTPRRFSALPGCRFPAGDGTYPSKNETARYLQPYATRFSLPVELAGPVQALTGGTDGFQARTDDGPVRARQVFVATGPYATAHVPAAAHQLSPRVRLHSSQHCRPSDLPDGPVVVVGCGNSAAQLACELAGTRDLTVVSSRGPWSLPKNIAGARVHWRPYLTGVLNADRQASASQQVRRRGHPSSGTSSGDGWQPRTADCYRSASPVRRATGCTRATERRSERSRSWGVPGSVRITRGRCARGDR